MILEQDSRSQRRKHQGDTLQTPHWTLEGVGGLDRWTDRKLHARVWDESRVLDRWTAGQYGTG